ncbi:permease YjgP/YjgQ family protein [Desulfovibrio sp. X2]|uniref:LPS export ABC transporter permease LptF n=1 Tax=Desulfovibrio sp. X2 TaxID=941449 RepID=UPI000358BAFA|nr:LPS export ABC transporter permease LptF [Desulfovibrio sp. X2]EPR42273.1 permease YjgP/YjgQ family protein [Desulfovibrio sp. X2]
MFAFRKIHWQILKELATSFALSLGALLGLILIGRMLQLKDLFLSQNLGFLEILELFGYLTPFFLLLLLPIACMLGVFLTFLRMSTDNELLALKAGGVSLYQLLAAPLVFCVLCTAVDFGVSFWGLSWGMDNFKSTVLEHARSRTQLVLQPGVFNREFPGLTLFAQQVDPGGKGLHQVFVRDETRANVRATIVAPEGQVATDTALGQIIFLLHDGHIYRQTGDKFDVLGFNVYAVRLDLSKLLGGFRLDRDKPKEMSLTHLLALQHDPSIKKKDDGVYLNKVRVEIQKRFALPAACFVLGLFALPVAFSFQGLKQHLGLLLALGCFLVYYTMLSVGLSLGETASLDPRVGLWVPNAVFLVVAGIGIRMAGKERYPHLFDWLAHLRQRFGRKAAAA